ncbi:MAG TPA: tRNA (guanosine(46)-N7)-methyltransferase TrmB, partial [Bacteroidales bacterium]|nr:tRNA (guanosine(46)-N7)-methyltransferase TrmB [Bacteroidales bacterium]
LKTDSELFYEYTLEVIRAGEHKLLYANNNLYSNASDEQVKDVIAVQTFYEQMWLAEGKTIKYLCFTIS